MSKKKETTGDTTPSADEIIEALALEMGVESQKVEGEAPPAAASEPTPEAAPEAEPEKKSDGMPDLGGIFDVPDSAPTKKKNAKRAAPAQPVSTDVDAIDSLFDVSGTNRDVDLDDLPGGDPLDEDKDLARLERKVGGGTNRVLIGLVVFMAIGMGGMAVFAFGGMDLVKDIGAVVDGTYNDKKDANVRRIEEEHRKKQLELMERYGTLNITGEPINAVVYMQLEGETTPTKRYAQTPSGLWRELTNTKSGAIIKNLKIKKPINIRIEAPGYRPLAETLTKDMWQDSGLGTYQYAMTRYLIHENDTVRGELEDRLLPFDEEMEVNGVIKVSSKPAGAKIKLNNRLVVDKDGKPILTTEGSPVILDQLMLDPEAKKKDPKFLKINTPPDNGYKIEIFTDDKEAPRYVTVVQRNQWKCTYKEDKALKKLKDDARPIEKCNYSFNVVGDFEAIKVEMGRLKRIEEDLKKQQEAIEKLNKETEEAAKKG
jgi:hypothetical protein